MNSQEVESGYGAFIPLEMIRSRAYYDLNSKGKVMLAVLLERRRRFRRNQHSLTYLELENFFGDGVGFSRGSIARCFKSLKRCGFITVVMQGGEFKSDRSTYELVDDWLHYEGDNDRRKDTNASL